MALRVDIVKRLGDFRLEASFENDGGRLALLGASGCGKSVTLRCIAGIMTPDEGVIQLDGDTLFDSSARIDLKPQRRDVGYLFQQYALFPNMTAEQNIRAVLRKSGDRDEQVKKMLAMFRLEDIAKSKPAQISGGQQQRLALARILASRPKALLLDEPFSALDSFLKAQLEQDLNDLLDVFSGEVLWVSHDRDEVFRNCDRICVMESGKTHPLVTPRELFYAPGTASAAKLSGCKNILGVTVGQNEVTVPEWGVTLSCGRPVERDVTAVGLRAHLFSFAREGEKNAIECSLVRAMDNVFSAILIFRPVGAAEDAPTLRVEASREQWDDHRGDGRFWLSIAPEDILLLK